MTAAEEAAYYHEGTKAAFSRLGMTPKYTSPVQGDQNDPQLPAEPQPETGSIDNLSDEDLDDLEYEQDEGRYDGEI
jgi:hypothetical protein